MGHRSPAVRYSREGREPRLFRDFGGAAARGQTCRDTWGRGAGHARHLAPACPLADAASFRSSGRMAGFTLIELMVTVAIIGIVAAIAYPSYVQYVVRSNRTAAESFLMELASLQERYLVDQRAYATTLGALGYAAPPDAVSANYTITLVTNTSPPRYQLTATPQGVQGARDTACGPLGLSQSGQRGASGASASCWK